MSQKDKWLHIEPNDLPERIMLMGDGCGYKACIHLTSDQWKLPEDAFEPHSIFELATESMTSKSLSPEELQLQEEELLSLDAIEDEGPIYPDSYFDPQNDPADPRNDPPEELGDGHFRF